MSLGCAGGRAGRGAGDWPDRAPDWLAAAGGEAALVVAIDGGRFASDRAAIADLVDGLHVPGADARAIAAAPSAWAAVRAALARTGEVWSVLPDELPGLDPGRPLALALFEPTVPSTLEYYRMIVEEGVEPGFRHRVLLPATDARALAAALQAALGRAHVERAAAGYYVPSEETRLRVLAEGSFVRLELVAGMHPRLASDGPPSEAEAARLLKKLGAWGEAAILRDVARPAGAASPAQQLLAARPGVFNAYLRGDSAARALLMAQVQKGFDAVAMVRPEERELIQKALAGEVTTMVAQLEGATNEIAGAALAFDPADARPVRIALDLTDLGRRAWDAALAPRGLPGDAALAAAIGRARAAFDLRATRAVVLPAPERRRDELLYGGHELLPFVVLLRPLHAFWTALGPGREGREIAAHLPFATTLTLSRLSFDPDVEVGGAGAALFGPAPEDLRSSLAQLEKELRREKQTLTWALSDDKGVTQARAGLNEPLGPTPPTRANDRTLLEAEVDVAALRRSLGRHWEEFREALPAAVRRLAGSDRLAMRWQRRDAGLWGELWQGKDAQPAFTEAPATSWVPPAPPASPGEACLERALLETGQFAQAIVAVDPEMRETIIAKARQELEPNRVCARKDPATAARARALDGITKDWWAASAAKK